MQEYADMLFEKYGFKMQVSDGSNDDAKTAILKSFSVVICAAVAGVRVLEQAHFVHSKSLKIMADVNAVAPSGIAGIEVMSDGNWLAETQIASFGALAIGQLKYKTQQRLLQNILASDSPVHFDFNHAFEIARSILSAK